MVYPYAPYGLGHNFYGGPHQLPRLLQGPADGASLNFVDNTTMQADAAAQLRNDVRRPNIRPTFASQRAQKTATRVNKLRLMDKPKTKYQDLSDEIRDLLSSKYNIKDADDWERAGEALCCLCGGEAADHYLNRCVKAWASTQAGRKFLGDARAAARVSSLTGAPPKTNMVSAEDVETLFAICGDTAADEEAIAEGLAHMCHYCAGSEKVLMSEELIDEISTQTAAIV
jgi:hypothetical protein